MYSPTITNTSFITPAENFIKADFDGVTIDSIPVKVGNADYDEIQKQIADTTISAVPTFATPAMSMDEFRQYRDGEMDVVDIKKASATQVDDMTAQELTDTKTWKQGMRDRPADGPTITAVAALDTGDKAGAVALFPTKPAIIA